MKIKIKTLFLVLALSSLELMPFSSNIAQAQPRGRNNLDVRDYCDSFANAYARRNSGGEVLGGAAAGAATGAAIGAIFGGGRGARRGASVGAITGAIGGGSRKARKYDDLYDEAFDDCMNRYWNN